MKWVRFKRLVPLAVAAMLSIMAFSLTGCGSSSSVSPVSPSQQFQQKVYIIGEIKDPMTPATGQIAVVQGPASAMNQIFVSRIPYDGVSTDGPIFITADSVKSISKTMQKGLQATYQNYNPIVVIRGGEEEINSVLGMIGLQQDYKSPKGFSYVELFAIDKEKGLNFRWVMLPPAAPSANNALYTGDEPTADSLKRAGMFRDWLSQNGSRVTAQVLADKKEATKALAAAANTSSQEVKDYVEGFNSAWTLGSENIYQLSYWVYALHDFKEKVDWFYVLQETQLNAAAEYKPYQYHAWSGEGYDVKKWYIGSYYMDNWVDISDPYSDKVQVFRTSPSTTTSKTELTTGMDWEFTGTFGFEGVKPTAKLVPKLTIKNEKKIEVPDCEVYNKSLDNGPNAKWLYQFGEVKPHIYFAYVGFDEPTTLQHNMFMPTNQWLWRSSEYVRANAKSFKSKFTADMINSNADGQLACCWFSHYQHIHQEMSMTLDVSLPYPPVLMVDDNELSLTKAAQSTAMDIGVGRDWTASCDQTWCRVEPASGTADRTRVNITVDANTTGASRKAIITFRTVDGKGTATTEIFQSQYDKP